MANNKNKKPLEFGMNSQTEDNKNTNAAKTKSNFTTALKEIFGEKEAPLAEETPARKEEPAKKQPATPQTASKFTPPPAAAKQPVPTPAAASTATAPSPAAPTPLHKPYQSLEPTEQTFITKDTIIEGSILTKSDIKISGCMKGNLTSDHDIYINGQVDGDVKGNAVTLNNGVVKGNITSESYINLNEKSIVIGDLIGDTVDSDGKVKGNLRITNSVALKSNAIVHGNITSKNINMQDGSVIKGSLEIICDEVIDEGDVFSFDDELKQIEKEKNQAVKDAPKEKEAAK